jgi:SAM-dependent methyltransferase
LAVAEALPFPDNAFDFVFSSHVWEHLQDRAVAVNEVVRVLRPGGYFACVVPGRMCKATSLLLNPVGYPLHVLGKLSAQMTAQRQAAALGLTRTRGAPRPGLVRVLKQCVLPDIHGTYTSHWAEYSAYGRQSWKRALTHPSLVPVSEVHLLFYSVYGLLRFRLIAVRAWLGRRGFAACHGFVLRKAEEGSPALPCAGEKRLAGPL